MRIYWLALAWLLGIMLAQQQAELPGNIGLIVLAMTGLLALICAATVLAFKMKHKGFDDDLRSQPARRQSVVWRATNLHMSCVVFVFLAATVVLAFAWASVMGQWRMAWRFPARLENTENVVRFQVTGMPAQLGTGAQAGIKVMIKVESVDAGLSTDVAHPFVSRDVLLNWSGACVRGCRLKVQPGQLWRAKLNWRAPHGRLNEFGPDPEQRMLQQGVAITARVRGQAVLQGQAKSLGFQTHLAYVRHHIAQRMLDALDGRPFAGVLVALAIGDQQGISPQQWEWFSRAGISHLIAISGTHVSLLASLLGTLACLIFTHLRWRARNAMNWLALAIVFAAAATAGALVYCLLAGWGIPAQRTFYTLAAAALAISGQIRLRLATHDCMALALLILTVFDPWSVLTSGLWLSFGAVASLLLMVRNALKVCTGSRSVMQSRTQKNTNRLWRAFCAILRLQVTVTLASLPMVAAMFHMISLVSLPANLWAVTWISLVVTPLTLFLALLAWLPLPGAWLVWPAALAHLFAECALVPAQWLASLDFAVWEVPAGPVWLVMLGMTGVLVALLAPPGTGRSMGWLLLLPQLLWRALPPEPGGWRMVAFDVGQGSAILVQTRNHQILFDTGWRNGEMDAVSRVILPQLRAMGIKKLDDVIVSHPDMDHIGGLDTLLRTREVSRLWGSGLTGYKYLPCQVGQSWSYDEVTFRMVAPVNQCASQSLVGVERNRCSCVLLVQGRWHKALLPGDIDVKVERGLLGLEASAVGLQRPSRSVARTKAAQARRDKRRDKRQNKQGNRQRDRQRDKQRATASARSLPQALVPTSPWPSDDRSKTPKGKVTAQQATLGISLERLAPVDVVLMAHHGSVSSSDQAWVRALAPAHAIAQCGHHNRFGHPHPDVLSRWRAQGARVWVSAVDGSIRIDSGQQGLEVVHARNLRQRYWHAMTLKVDSTIEQANTLK